MLQSLTKAEMMVSPQTDSKPKLHFDAIVIVYYVCSSCVDG